MQLISGHPRHPQSQGLVEQAHYTLERMMSAKVVECGDQSPPWTQWLPHIVCKPYLIILYALNVMCLQIQWTLRFTTTPYELVFGQPPRAKGHLLVTVKWRCFEALVTEKFRRKQRKKKKREWWRGKRRGWWGKWRVWFRGKRRWWENEQEKQGDDVENEEVGAKEKGDNDEEKEEDGEENEKCTISA